MDKKKIELWEYFKNLKIPKDKSKDSKGHDTSDCHTYSY